MSRIARIAAAVCFASILSGCISSTEPMLTDARPLFGEHLRLQLYTLRGGYAGEPQQAAFNWNGKRYVYVSGNARGMNDFTLHAFDGGFIAQSLPRRGKGNFEYALVRKLADGVYRVMAIDEDDADPATRSEYCTDTRKASCLIRSAQALTAFARATAARNRSDGGLAIRLADQKTRKR